MLRAAVYVNVHANHCPASLFLAAGVVIAAIPVGPYSHAIDEGQFKTHHKRLSEGM